ncbi:hypothetical protein FRX31_006608 [Thalictrum thalictroides]|uniref:Uncharacterized protein n=1 Tax=Thalictrum thalictroides TaxID=46969 RepID=A0A7J6X4M7_THATH|nr:hypothetical protein FRX31_006608 [Thalictrum thalictroides]
MASSSGPSGTELRRRAAHIIGRLYGAIRRSTCEHHFNEFHPFHIKLSEVAWGVARSDSEMQKQLLTLFLVAPQRIDETTWVKFDSWLKTEIAASIKNVCIQWQYYGRNTFAMIS